MLKRKWCKIIFCTIACALLGTVDLPTSSAVQTTTRPVVTTFGSPQASFTEVIEGGVGTAYLVYHLESNPPEQPAIVVRLSRNNTSTDALAEVFETPSGERFVPVELVDGFLVLPDTLQPVVTLKAHDGWWSRNNIINFNLDIMVYGQVMAMWASGGETGWTRLLEPGEANAHIIVRDYNSDGLPDWDWRTMLPEFSNRADYRTTYAERKCATPISIQTGVSPAWPFIADDSEFGFEQSVGILRPPILVDWEVGRVQTVSEIVTLRNQNCSYGMHSITRILPKQLNSPNFEVPFAFYDLSGQGDGYPNLLLRTQRVAESTNNPETQMIRYSWRNQVGDLHWDYKVEVLGQYRYDAETPIAGGATYIDAPNYEVFPSWVIERKWPTAMFIAIEEADSYQSTEGIYEWSPLGLSEEFYLGWQAEPVLTRYQDIRKGLRGEYRLKSTQRVVTYLSPIDNRLHLKWAEEGIWRLDNQQIIRLSNLNSDATIDVWSRELMPDTGAADIQTESTEQDKISDNTLPKPQVIESLYALDGYLLHHDESGMSLLRSTHDPILFETLPPMDHETWETHRTLLAPYESERRDPANLRAWLDVFTGQRMEIEGVNVSNVRIADDGFRFEISLDPGFQIADADLIGLSNISPGNYLIEHSNDQFTVSPLVPPDLNLDIDFASVGDASSTALINVENRGTADAPDLSLVIESLQENGTISEISRTIIDAPGGETERMLIDIPIPSSAATILQVRLEDPEGQVITVDSPMIPEEPTAAKNAMATLWQAPAVVPVLLLFALVVAATTVIVLMRRPEDSSL